MVTESQVKQALEAGYRAEQNARNPYTQRDGDLWHVANQDELFDAWQQGYWASHEEN